MNKIAYVILIINKLSEVEHPFQTPELKIHSYFFCAKKQLSMRNITLVYDNIFQSGNHPS